MLCKNESLLLPCTLVLICDNSSKCDWPRDGTLKSTDERIMDRKYDLFNGTH